MELLHQNLRYLCDETRMLTGITAAYGTPTQSECCRYGRAQELELHPSGYFESAIRPLTEDSIYDLASLTKLFTCVLAMMLVEHGRLSLEEDIFSIDKRFEHLRGVRLGDVLCFRAHLQTPGRIDTAPDRGEALQRLFQVARAESPRIRLYSDINAMVAKYVIEAKTNLPFFEALKKYILSPAGLDHTYAHVPESLRHHCLCYNYEHRIAKQTYTMRTDTQLGMPHDPKAALLSPSGEDLCGHAGLFSTSADMIRFAQALLGGKLLRIDTLSRIGVNRTGMDYGDGTHRQYLGYLCFTKHPNQHLSEVPVWTQEPCIGLSGFTGNHIVLDPNKQRFVLFLGNRCHGRVSNIVPPEGVTLDRYGLNPDGTGSIQWPDGRFVPSSAKYVYFKDARLHAPIADRMTRLGWL